MNRSNKDSIQKEAIALTLKVIVLVGIIIAYTVLSNLSKKNPVESSPTDNGSHLGGAMGGGTITPEDLSKEVKQGTMKVLISSPSGDRVIEVNGAAGGYGEPSEVIGGDNSKAVGGSKGGQ